MNNTCLEPTEFKWSRRFVFDVLEWNNYLLVYMKYVNEKFINEFPWKPLKPCKFQKLTQAKESTESVKQENDDLKSDLQVLKNNSNIFNRVHWFTGARNVATGKAQVTLEAFIVSTFGNEANYQAAVDSGDAAQWDSHWKNFEFNTMKLN